MQLLGLLLGIAVLGMLLTARWSFLQRRAAEGMLLVTLPTSAYLENSEKLLSLLERSVPTGRIDSIAENRDESVISYSFRKLEPGRLLALRRELEGITPLSTSSVFFSQSRYP